MNFDQFTFFSAVPGWTINILAPLTVGFQSVSNDFHGMRFYAPHDPSADRL